MSNDERETYKGVLCQWCGSRVRYVHGRNCVSCHNYRMAIKNRLIHGIDGRKKGPKSTKHEWCDEEGDIRSEAIKRGLARKKVGPEV